jgi:AraC family transcriptional regulator, transcriptional activator of the genes for pyochelin and ferripyochelin receptors
MTLLLSETELYLQYLQDCSDHPDLPEPDSWTGYLNDPRKTSQGCRTYIALCPGIDLQIDDYILYEDLLVAQFPSIPESCLELSFSVWGDNRTEQTPQGQNFLSGYVSDETGENFLRWQAGDRVLKFDIHMDFEFFATLINGRYDQLPAEFTRILLGNDVGEYLNLTKTTPAMQAIVNQILTCPFDGVVRRFYLEAKVLELIALRLQQLEVDRTDSSMPYLSPAQIKQLHLARQLLLSQLEHPPTLLDLAQQVGINHNKLKRGFRTLFGTTVFGYLHNHRMQKALQLLQEGGMTVAAVASAIG